MHLAEWGEQLERIVPEPPSWLFTCEGSPFDCRLLLVGTNPARNTGKPFWRNYWSKETGQKQGALLTDLAMFPRHRGTGAPLGWTKTRAKIEGFRGLVRTKIFEANVYKRNTERANDLQITDQREEEMFRFILKTIEPTLLVAHGDDAFGFFSGMCDTLIKKSGAIQQFYWDTVRSKFVYCRHFAMVRNDEFDQLIAVVNEQFVESRRPAAPPA